MQTHKNKLFTHTHTHMHTHTHARFRMRARPSTRRTPLQLHPCIYICKFEVYIHIYIHTNIYIYTHTVWNESASLYAAYLSSAIASQNNQQHAKLVPLSWHDITLLITVHDHALRSKECIGQVSLHLICEYIYIYIYIYILFMCLWGVCVCTWSVE